MGVSLAKLKHGADRYANWNMESGRANSIARRCIGWTLCRKKWQNDRELSKVSGSVLFVYAKMKAAFFVARPPVALFRDPWSNGRIRAMDFALSRSADKFEHEWTSHRQHCSIPLYVGFRLPFAGAPLLYELTSRQTLAKFRPTRRGCGCSRVLSCLPPVGQ